VRPVAPACALCQPVAEQIERLIVAAKKDKPHWGARKIRELLVRRLAGDVRNPAASIVHAVHRTFSLGPALFAACISLEGMCEKPVDFCTTGKPHGGWE
jgi:hypothetical protein